MAEPHHTTFRVYYEDTDFSGFVYHAGYLRFFERGRTEFLRAAGVMQSVLHRDASGLLFVVSRIEVDYLRPAAMDDLLAVSTAVVEARGPMVRMRQEIRRDAGVLSRALVTVIAVRDGRPTRVPADVRAAMERLVGPE